MRSLRSFALVALVALCFSTQVLAATLTATTLTTAGTTIASAGLTAVAAGGDKCPNDGDTFVVFLNSSGSNSYTITFDAVSAYYGVNLTDPTATVGTSAHVVVGPFPTAAFSDSGGYLNFTYTGTAPATDLKAKCVRMPD